MSHYIEKTDTIARLHDYTFYGDVHKISGIDEAVRVVGGMPEADVAPVKHSHWEVAIGYDPRRAFQCQNCFKMALEISNYCPNCGARMYEEATE